MRYYHLDSSTRPVLFEALGLRYRQLSPGNDVTSHACWLPATDWPDPVPAASAASVKRFLLPPDETVWSEAPVNTIEQPIALLGVPVCDLAAVALLDRVFAGDATWQRRRRNLFLVGAGCLADAACFCRQWEGLPPCDLFVDADRLWLVSSRAEQVFARVGLPLTDAGDYPSLPTRARQAPAQPALSSYRLPDRQALQPYAERCLGCGTCAAECPTCHCFDLRDIVTDAGLVERRRVWDCCQFLDHGLVAGGHNFRPQRVDRLHFRLEHKLAGFGALRGTGCCVGCGRCERVCPSGLGVHQVLAAVVEG